MFHFGSTLSIHVMYCEQGCNFAHRFWWLAGHASDTGLHVKCFFLQCIAIPLNAICYVQLEFWQCQLLRSCAFLSRLAEPDSKPWQLCWMYTFWETVRRCETSKLSQCVKQIGIEHLHIMLHCKIIGETSRQASYYLVRSLSTLVLTYHVTL